MVKTPLWTTLSHGKTVQQAADEFAAEWWDKPRKASKVQDGRFRIKDGVATYEVSEDNGLYRVARIDQ